MLVEPIESVMHENVMPWMINKMIDFLTDEDFIASNVNAVVNDAFEMGRQMHQKSVKAEYKRRDDEVLERERKIQQKEDDRQRRRAERERLRKEQELRKLKDEIKAFFVDKGDVREHMAQLDIIDINGHYEKGKPFVGALGGQLMQICLALQGILYTALPEGEEDKKKDKSVKDLLNNPNLLNVMLNFIKEMKNEHL